MMTDSNKSVAQADAGDYYKQEQQKPTATDGIDIDMIEFFSGIGGMRLGVEMALQKRQKLTAAQQQQQQQETVFSLNSCHAYEISLHANKVYHHNFKDDSNDNNNDNQEQTKIAAKNSNVKRKNKRPSFAVHTKLVEQLKPDNFHSKQNNVTIPNNNSNKLLWTMSPPCQPFTNTRGGKLLDAHDKRCRGLQGILQLLTKLPDDQKPKWIFLENVKGFFKSQMCLQVYECLKQNGYTWKEYLLSPIQLGIPNHRLRYYLLCERSSRFHHQETSSIIGSDESTSTDIVCTDLPPSYHLLQHTDTNTTTTTLPTQPLSQYLLPLSLEESKPFLISDDVLQQEWAKDLSIVSGSSTQTYCFTAAYSRILHKATGSLVLVNHHHATTSATASANSSNDDILQYSNNLRRLTPKELLNLFGFPEDFEFPKDTTLEHQYKLIGNSVNVTVVTVLIYELLFGGSSGGDNTDD